MNRLLANAGIFVILSSSVLAPTPSAAESPLTPPQEIKSICEEFTLPDFPTVNAGECMAGWVLGTFQNSGAIAFYCQQNADIDPDGFFSRYDSVAECIQESPKGPPRP